MAIWKSVEYLEVSITNALEPVTTNLTKGQDETKCIPLWGQRYTAFTWADFNDSLVEITIVDNGGTAALVLTATAMLETSAIVYGVFVVEFDSSINVQQVSADGLSNTVASVNVAITDVGTQASAFMIYSYQHDLGNAFMDDGMVQVRFEGAETDSVTISRRLSANNILGTLYVVDCDSAEFIVDHQEIDVTTAGNETQSATISATVLADSFLLHSYESAETQGDMRDVCWQAHLADTTTLTIDRNNTAGSNATSTHSIQVIECQNSEWSVQREIGLTIAAATQTDAITQVDTTRAFIARGGYMQMPQGRNASVTENDNHEIACISKFTSISSDLSSEVSWICLSVGTIATSIVAYEIVEFAALSSGATIIVPTGPWR